ncbi:hypothetical protein AMJ51_00965 [Microgenomates bacterium DG_75]|nr:MAG: hypothetical protein AMJ51_00965 [Microgenomates bacterium DG_75]
MRAVTGRDPDTQPQITLPISVYPGSTIWGGMGELVVKTPQPEDETFAISGDEKAITTLHEALKYFPMETWVADGVLHIANATYVPKKQMCEFILPTETPLPDGYALALRLVGRVIKDAPFPFSFTVWGVGVIEQ